ncbi:hypothetical protein AB1L42_19635 [Thalassoglobus sp. JC818]|uniref:hypothetical protein n=1 Tax=Thalassoglobus sp. JC818 TaxID=3232136 RepID=UPI003458E440
MMKSPHTDVAESLFKLLTEELHLLEQTERLIRELLSHRSGATNEREAINKFRDLESELRKRLERSRSNRLMLSKRVEFEHGVRHFVRTSQRLELQEVFYAVIKARSNVRGLARVMNFHARTHLDVFETIVRAATGSESQPQYDQTGRLAAATLHTILELRS